MRKHISNFPCHFRQKDEGMRKTCGRRSKGETNEMKTDANQSQIGREKNQGQFGSSRGIRGKQLQEVVHIGNKEVRVFYCNANFKNSNFKVLLLFNEGSVSNVNRKSNGFKVILPTITSTSLCLPSTNLTEENSGSTQARGQLWMLKILSNH